MRKLRKKERKVALLLLVIVDQLSKYLALKFNFGFINSGISFGLFSSFAFSWLLFLISGFIIIMFLLSRSKPTLPLWLIILGGFSNLIDRVIRLGVVDFINLPIIPVFNLADLMIVVGAIWLFIDLVKSHRVS